MREQEKGTSVCCSPPLTLLRAMCMDVYGEKNHFSFYLSFSITIVHILFIFSSFPFIHSGFPPRTTIQWSGLDVHWSDLSVHPDSCSEVELVTLIQEQTPLYKLRADPLTSFSGISSLQSSLFVLILPPACFTSLPSFCFLSNDLSFCRL